MSRRILWLTLAGLAVSLLAIPVVFQSSYVAVEQLIPAIPAKTTTSFIDSLGFGTHMWGLPISFDNYTNALTDLNVRYVRDDLKMSYAQYQATNQTWLNRVTQLRDLGIKTSAISHGLKVPPADVVRYVKESGGGIYAVEGPNEVDAQCYPHGTAFTGNIWFLCPANLWLAITEQYVRDIKTALKADTQTHSTILYSPSIDRDNYNVGSTVFAANADYGNVHYYPYIADNIVDSIHNEVTSAQNGLYPGKPMVLTEIGYPSAPLAEFNNHPANEAWQAKVLPLYWLEAYKEGVSKTFLYELVDADATEHWGIIDHQGRKKPAYFSLKNLTDTLKDTGGSFSPTTLRYSLEGNVTGVSSLLFQKQDGRFYLALWQSALAASPPPNLSTGVATKTVSLHLGDSISQVKSISPVDGQGATQTFNQPTTINNLAVGDKPLILEIQPTTQGNTNSSGSNSATGNTSGSNTSGKASTGGGATKNPATSSTSGPSNNSAVVTPETTATENLGLPGTNTQKKIGFWRRVANFFVFIYYKVAGWF